MSKAEYLEAVFAQLGSLVSDGERHLLTTFAQLFWARTLDEDLLSRDVGETADITLECWRRLGDHDGRQVNILLSNPSTNTHLVQGRRTVVLVTAPNMPFMVDSILMALSHDGLITDLLTNVVFAVERATDGNITDISADLGHANRELLIYAEIDRLDDAELPPLYERLQAMARELEAVVADYGPMKQVVEGVLHDLRSSCKTPSTTCFMGP